jgi:S-DNA-T family DNA segregation ATPase FtsK/SpoIIIE
MSTVIEIAAPPEVPRSATSSPLFVLLPIVMCVVMLGVTLAAYVSGSPIARSPTFLVFPTMMLASSAVTAVVGRGRRRGVTIDADRDDYLEYLSGLRNQVVNIAVAQHDSLTQRHPVPDALWTLVGGPGMWVRQPADPDFCRVRVGVGTQPLAARLVTAPSPTPQRSDPVTATALRRFLRTQSTISNAPIVIPLCEGQCVAIDGEVTRVRGLIRAMICQLAVSHAPAHLLIVAVVAAANRTYWDWLKWLPHNQHPSATDDVGASRMFYPTLALARDALVAVSSPRVLVIVDAEEDADSVVGATVLVVGGDGTSVSVRHAAGQEVLASPDWLELDEALACARRLAAYAGGPAPRTDSGWAGLLGIGDIGAFDPVALWRNQDRRDRLCVPIGVTLDDKAVMLDIKEAAAQGVGPHGLCVGATGSGKSELLRTVALGMMARNSPEVLNLLLIDFKGGATFLDLAGAPHVAAVITNLADEAPLVTRMRDALAGEMNRRQQLLREAGNFVSAAAYNERRGTGSPALPTLFIIVDEFSELLSQHPDFAEMFVAIARLGRSLGMHLLLASQRLDEGRLRGLDAHLSYRICLKTLSSSESRAVLGTTDAYELPNTPGAGLLRTTNAGSVRFQTAYVSGQLATKCASSSGPPVVQRFTAESVGPVLISGLALGTLKGPGQSVMHAVLDRLAGQGPPAHRVWLPPLDAAPTLSGLLRAGARVELTVPIGVVDRPYDQARTPLTVDLSGAAGNVAVVGAPQSGKSTALCTLLTALAATHDPGQVQFYCLDFGGGALSSLSELPHVGSVADRAQPELVRRMVGQLESTVRTREISFRDRGIDSMALYRQHRAASHTEPCADVFLVVDGWSVLRDECEVVQERITRLAAQGLSYGVHIVLSATRWAEIRPALRDQIGTRVELRLGDPADSELDRKIARQVPVDRPGRGVSRDGLHMMIALPGLDGLALRQGDSVAPPIPLLPNEVAYDAVVADHGSGTRLMLGIEERNLAPISVDFEQHRHLVVLGDNGCGKTAALRTLCRETVRNKTAEQVQLFVVDFRRTLLGVVAPEYLGGYAMSPVSTGVLLPGLVGVLRERMPAADVSEEQLRAGSWWTGPTLYVVVDDYDLVATPAGNPLLALLEYLPYAADLGLHVIVARRSGGAARALFEPLLASLRDLGCMGLMMSGRPDEGMLLGSSLPAPLPPGRGVLITKAGVEQLVQIAWTPPA